MCTAGGFNLTELFVIVRIDCLDLGSAPILKGY